MLREMLIGRCRTVYKIYYSAVTERPGALLSPKLLNRVVRCSIGQQALPTNYYLWLPDCTLSANSRSISASGPRRFNTYPCDISQACSSEVTGSTVYKLNRRVSGGAVATLFVSLLCFPTRALA